MEERGLEPISMTDIAQRAGLSKAALYRYFPHKAALLRALSVSVLEEDRGRLRTFIEEEPGEPTEVLAAALVDYCRRSCQDSFRPKLRLAMHADDELSRLDFEDSRKNARAIARFLLEQGVEGKPAEVEQRVLLVLELVDGLVRVMLQVGKRRQRQLQEDFIRMVEPYLLGRLQLHGAASTPSMTRPKVSS
ncbi:MAG: TetR/AcrR family transcriptional regulator [Myxococcota bacterium]